MMDGVLIMWVLQGEETDVEQAKLSRVKMSLILVQIKMENSRKPLMMKLTERSDNNTIHTG